ncbi:MAG TPA: FAD:protein FMN transferase [Opitutaceae bacterium]|nr:FAD:protein FMN transferase [Opitutaceae bacterium]
MSPSRLDLPISGGRINTISIAETSGLRRVRFHALGTTCTLLYRCVSEELSRLFENEVVSWVESFESRYSRFRPQSLISRINAAAGQGAVDVDDEMEAMLELADLVHRVSGGLMDATLLPLMRIWDYHRRPSTLPSDGEMAATRALTGWSLVSRGKGRVFLPRRGMALDFGGFGKEYAVDHVVGIASRYGLTSVLIDFGHDVFGLGTPPGRPCWQVGLEDPQRPGSTLGALGVVNRGVAASGDYHRHVTIGGRRYGHILDPRTGWPVSHTCQQATVVAPTCLQAGVLSTTAFILGLNEGLRFLQGFPDVEGCLVTPDQRGQTRGFFNYVIT